MSSLTTSEQLSKQLSIIFGFSGREDLEVGNIIGVGKLTSEKINELVFEMLRYLNAYNAMLRDYAGTEIFAIEFELKNFMEKQSELNLMPKSMILIPGEYKDCNIFLLALTNETSLLDLHKAKESIDDLGKIFFEVQEAIERPDLDEKEKRSVLAKFAERFSLKVQGELLEGRWNKKLVGIKTAAPSEQENLKPFLEIQSKYYINWDHIPHDLTPENPKYTQSKLSISDSLLNEHIKWRISGPSTYYITQNTFQLGANLLKIANTGSIDEIEEMAIKEVIEEIKNHMNAISGKISFEDIQKEAIKLLRIFKDDLKNFEQIIDQYLKSGEKGTVKEAIESIHNRFNDELADNNNIKILLKIFSVVVEQGVFENENSIKAVEIRPLLDYFIEMISMSHRLIQDNFNKYLAYIYLLKSFEQLIESLKNELETEQKSAKALGFKFLSKFSLYLSNKINEKIINTFIFTDFNRENIIKMFKTIVQNAIEHYLDEISIYSEDLIEFAEIMLGEQTLKIEKHLERLKKARLELNYLLSFILRNSTLNRFMKELDDKRFLDPTTLSKEFYDFLWKRIGGLTLYWKDFFLSIIKQYPEKYQNQFKEEKDWTRFKILDHFINYLKESILEYLKTDKFTEILDNYISQIQDPTEKSLMNLFFEQYRYSLGILDEFPGYMKKKFLKIFTQLNLSFDNFNGMDYFTTPKLEILKELNGGLKKSEKSAVNSTQGFFEFMDEFELKYFAKLIARPARIVLRGIDKGIFSDSLYYNIDFKFWEKFFKLSLSNNWLQIRPRF